MSGPTLPPAYSHCAAPSCSTSQVLLRIPAIGATCRCGRWFSDFGGTKMAIHKVGHPSRRAFAFVCKRLAPASRWIKFDQWKACHLQSLGLVHRSIHLRNHHLLVVLVRLCQIFIRRCQRLAVAAPRRVDFKQDRLRRVPAQEAHRSDGRWGRFGRRTKWSSSKASGVHSQHDLLEVGTNNLSHC